MSAGIQVTMSLAEFEELKNQLGMEGYSRGLAAGENQLIGFLARVARGEVPATDVDYSAIAPGSRAQVEQIIKLLDLASIADRVQKNALLSLPKIQAKLIEIERMGIDALTVWINNHPPDTMDEALLYDRGMARLTHLRRNLEGVKSAESRV